MECQITKVSENYSNNNITTENKYIYNNKLNEKQSEEI